MCSAGAIEQAGRGSSAVKLTVTCNEALQLTLMGTATPPAAKAKRSKRSKHKAEAKKFKPLAIIPVSTTVNPSPLVTVGLPGAAGRALAKGARASLARTVVLTDAQGHSSTTPISTTVTGKAEKSRPRHPRRHC